MIDKVYSWDLNKFIETINALVEESNVHEKQIDELQMKAEPHKCEPAENSQSAKIAQDPYEKERKWIGKLCRFWDANPDKRQLDILIDIDSGITPYEIDTSYYQNCEPVKPDDSIIYKGGDNE